MRLEEKDLTLLTVGDIMAKKVYTIDADESIRRAADLMSKNKIGCLVVTEDEEESEIAGILTESDILRRVVAVGANPGETRVRVVMSRPLIFASPELPLSNAVLLMCVHKVKKIPVVEKEGESERLVGLVTLTDIAGIQPALIVTLKEFYEEKGEAPPRSIKKVMDYYVV